MDQFQIARERVLYWASEELVGKPAVPKTLRFFKQNAKRIVAEALNVEPNAVRIDADYAEGGILRFNGFTIK